MKKYEFTGEIMEYNGHTLHRIRRISDGLTGGWIEQESNLSHDDDCFVYNEAKVFGCAMVSGNAKVHEMPWCQTPMYMVKHIFVVML